MLLILMSLSLSYGDPTEVLERAIGACVMGSSERCFKFSMQYITELKSERGYTTVFNDFSNIAKGIVFGMRKNRETDSECIKEGDNILTPWTELLDTLDKLTNTGNPELTFDLGLNLNNIINNLVSIAEVCSLRSLTNKYSELYTRNGFGRALFNVAMSYNTTADIVQFLIEDVILEHYYSAGVSTGEIISIILDYYF